MIRGLVETMKDFLGYLITGRLNLLRLAYDVLLKSSHYGLMFVQNDQLQRNTVWSSPLTTVSGGWGDIIASRSSNQLYNTLSLVMIAQVALSSESFDMLNLKVSMFSTSQL